MFDFLKNKEVVSPQWLSEISQTQERWFSFLEKLEVKLEELCSAAIPELKEMLHSDDDTFQRTFYKVQSGINGQLENIRKKAYDTYDEKVNDVYYSLSKNISTLSPDQSLLDDFRTACSDRYHQEFEEKLYYWQNEIEKACKKDLEPEYQKIMEEYESIKNKFTCKQCGSPIAIKQIFFISTYIECPACNTQNTFEPSTQARGLQNIANELAEQRTKHLYDVFHVENNMERELYHQKHTLGLSTIHEKDKKILAEKEQQMEALEKRRQQAITEAPKLYQQYLRAKYDELNAITPDFKEHNEAMYQNQINLK